MTVLKICPYCISASYPDNLVCIACGGPLIAPVENEALKRQNPFAYNGYIVWPLVDFARAVDEFHFYLGLELQGIVEISHFDLREMVAEGTDSMPFIWELFLVGRGEKEMMVRDVKPFQYRITKALQAEWSFSGDFLYQEV